MDELLLGQNLPKITNLLLKKFLQNNETSFTQKKVVLRKRKKINYPIAFCLNHEI